MTADERFDAELTRLQRPDILAGVRSGAWLDGQEFPPLTYHLPGVIPEGSTLLVGAPKIGKSWLVLTLALAAASGGRALGLEVEARPVFYLALEDGDRRLQDRCRKLLLGDPIPSGFEYLTFLEPGQVTETVEAWLSEHPGTQPLVILDTLGKVMPPAMGGESAYSRDYRIGSALKRLADINPGSAILTNHHDRKAGSDDFVDRVSGTNGLAGAADTVVVIDRARGEPSGTISVTGRDIIEGDYAVTFDGDAGLWTLDGHSLAEAAHRAHTRKTTQGVGDISVSIIAYLDENPEGVTPSQIAGALDLDPNAVGVYLKRLLEAERIARPARGLYTPVTPPNPVTSVTSLPNTLTGLTGEAEGEPS